MIVCLNMKSNVSVNSMAALEAFSKYPHYVGVVETVFSGVA